MPEQLMSHAEFHTLIISLCQILKLPPPAVAIEPLGTTTYDLLLNGVEFTLGFNAMAAPGLITVVCHFGQLPKSEDRDALAALMELNLFLSHSGNQWMCLAPHDAEVLLVSRAHLPGLDGQSLLGTMRRQGETAAQWRAEHFLGVREPRSEGNASHQRI
jgi:hypothetical protein